MESLYLLIGLAGFAYLMANEIEDECVRNTFTFCEEYLNSNIAWKNKWYWNEEGEQIPNQRPAKCYLWIFEPDYQERFYLSTTLFVFITDGEHLFQFIKNTAILLGFLAIGWELALAWFIGKSIAQLVKELIPWIS